MRRSNFAQCLDRSPVTTGDKVNIEWCDPRFENGCYINGVHYTLIEPNNLDMSYDDLRDVRTARLDAKIAQAATTKTTYACPDLDQDYALDEPYHINPYHPYQTNFKGQVP